MSKDIEINEPGFEDFNNLVEEVRKDFNVPGIAVAIIKEDQIILNYSEPFVEVIIGRPGNQQTDLSTVASSKPDNKLIRYVRKKHGISKSLDVDKLRAEFLSGVAKAK